MKKTFFLYVSFLLLHENVYSMNEEKKDKKEHKAKKFPWQKSKEKKEQSDQGLLHIGLLNEENEPLPNLFLSSLAQVLNLTPRQFLNTAISVPSGRVRDYSMFQLSCDKERASQEEHNNTINNYITQEIFSHDENIIVALAKLRQEQLTTMYFPLIHARILDILQQKIKDTQKNINDRTWALGRLFLLGLNSGIVVYGGLRLWSHYDHKWLGGIITGIGTTGLCTLLPKFIKHGSSIKDSLMKLKTYRNINSKEYNENVVVYQLTNEITG